MSVSTISYPYRICAVCQHSTPKKCERCQKIYYCSVECQTKDWTKHKTMCKRTVIRNEPLAQEAPYYDLVFKDSESSISLDVERIGGSLDGSEVTIDRQKKCLTVPGREVLLSNEIDFEKNIETISKDGSLRIIFSKKKVTNL